MPGRKAVFLDRDGVLNDITVRGTTPYPPANRNEVRILPGVPEALAELKSAEFLLIVVTNQPDVARGTQSAAEVDAINAVLAENLPLDEFRVCMHDNADNCLCRKPKPGMILQSAAANGIDPAASFMVGDRAGDVLAGAAAGCRTILIARPYSNAGQCRPDFTAQSLAEAARIIIGLDHAAVSE